MSDVHEWSTSASGNQATSPDGMPEGMDKRDVAKAFREVMASARRWYQDPEFLERFDGETVDRLSETTFRIQGSDRTADITAGKRIRVFSGDSFSDMNVSSVAFDGVDTVVTVPASPGVPIGADRLATHAARSWTDVPWRGIGISSPTQVPDNFLVPSLIHRELHVGYLVSNHITGATGTAVQALDYRQYTAGLLLPTDPVRLVDADGLADYTLSMSFRITNTTLGGVSSGSWEVFVYTTPDPASSSAPGAVLQSRIWIGQMPIGISGTWGKAFSGIVLSAPQANDYVRVEIGRISSHVNWTFHNGILDPAFYVPGSPPCYFTVRREAPKTL